MTSPMPLAVAAAATTLHLLLALLALSPPTPAAGALPRSCLGGVPLNTDTERGLYWYHCTARGLLTKQGCLDPARRRIRTGETYVQNQYVMRCEIQDDYLQILPYGCADPAGELVLPGSSWQDEKFWYTCQKEDRNVAIDVSGCMLGDDRLAVSERKRKGELLYECSLKQAGAVALCSIGCIYNGQEYLLGQTFRGTHFEYKCTKEGGWCHTAAVGCLDETGQVHADGASWQAGDGHYRCKANVGDNASEAELIVEGCADRGTNPGYIHRVGEAWEEGDTRLECRVSDRRAQRYVVAYGRRK